MWTAVLGDSSGFCRTMGTPKLLPPSEGTENHRQCVIRLSVLISELHLHNPPDNKIHHIHSSESQWLETTNLLPTH